MWAIPISSKIESVIPIKNLQLIFLHHIFGHSFELTRFSRNLETKFYLYILVVFNLDTIVKVIAIKRS